MTFRPKHGVLVFFFFFQISVVFLFEKNFHSFHFEYLFILNMFFIFSFFQFFFEKVFSSFSFFHFFFFSFTIFQ